MLATYRHWLWHEKKVGKLIVFFGNLSINFQLTLHSRFWNIKWVSLKMSVLFIKDRKSNGGNKLYLKKPHHVAGEKKIHPNPTTLWRSTLQWNQTRQMEKLPESPVSVSYWLHFRNLHLKKGWRQTVRKEIAMLGHRNDFCSTSHTTTVFCGGTSCPEHRSFRGHLEACGASTGWHACDKGQCRMHPLPRNNKDSTSTSPRSNKTTFRPSEVEEK